MKRFVIGNWKENPSSTKKALDILRGVKKAAGLATKVETVLIPPAVFLSTLQKETKASKRITLGGQGSFWEEEGAFTGSIGPGMLKDVGAKYILVGHSEQRAAGVTDAMVNKKMKAVLKAGVKPILCVGERRRDNDGKFVRLVRDQIAAALHGIQPKQIAPLVVAYEPIWAIGTGKAASDKDALEMALLVRHTLIQLYSRKTAERIPVLYGGSVNTKNCDDFLEHSEIAGFLVGGASLQPKEFSQIIQKTNARS